MNEKKNASRQEKVKELKILLEQKNRELEIEAALKGVRAVAMGMNQPGDMIDVCRIISEQLQILKVENIRNVQTAIINDEKGTYLNYEFFTQYNTTSILEIKSDLHPKVLEFVKSIKKSRDAFFTTHFKGKDLKDWIDYRRKTNQNSDPILDKAKSVHYYFYSIGPGALGLSTYVPLSSKQLEVFRRFHNVFMLAYKRFMDIKKAEDQAREAHIEAALERVRAASMAMHKSEDLTKVAKVLNKELQLLGLTQSATCGFVIVDEKEKIQHYYGSPAGKNFLEYFQFPLTGDQILRNRYEAWNRKDLVFIQSVSGKKLQKHLAVVLPDSEITEAERNAKLGMPDPTHFYLGNFAYGYLQIIASDTLSEDQISLLPRFAKVFEQTYTRFLDLQQAEAQAREAQIEAAVERVRAEAMSMHSSDDFGKVAKQLLQQVQKLHLEGFTGAFILLIDENEFMTAWDCSSPGNIGDAKSQVARYDANKYQLNGVEILNKWKGGDNFFVIDFDLERLQTVIKEWQEIDANIANDFKEAISRGHLTHQWNACGRLSNGILSFDMIKPPDDDVERITIRMSKAFEQAHTRFLDLKKAEEQAKEAQIEAALERVRARSMAMHKSEDLADLSLELVKQVQALGVATWFCAFNIYDQDPKGSLEWGSNGQGTFPKYRTPREGIFLRYYEAGQNGEAFLINEIDENECPAHYDYLCSLPGVGEQLLKMKDAGISFPTSQIDHVAFFEYGYIIFITFESAPEAHDIFKRFAKVFEQTYTRFLDLQKAEIQAHEAQIETALEKVRARSLAMHKSEELQEVIQVVYQQMVQLEIFVEHAGFIMDYKERDDMHIWLADHNGAPSEVAIPYFDSPHWNSFIEAKEKGEDFFVNHLDFKEKNRFYRTLFKHIPGLPEEAKKHYLSCPGLAISTVLLGNVGLYIENFSGTPYSDEENNTFIRFGKVFQQTYTRFLDLQKAEAQARESQIEAALEGVRAQAMAMHRSDELQEVVAIVFEKLQELNFSLDGAAFIITHLDEPQEVKLWIGDNVKKYATYFKTPHYDTEVINDLWKARKSGIDFFVRTYSFKEKNHWFEHAFNNTDYKSMPDSRKKWILEQPYLTQAFALNSNSMIGIHAHHPKILTENEIDILKRFSIVFEQGYTRFLDLQKAEAQAREAQIEASLERVRARALAMHNTEELNDVLCVLFEQFDILEINPVLTHLTLFDEANDTFSLMITTSPENKVIAQQVIDVNAVESWKNSFKLWKEGKPGTVDCIDYPPEVLPAVWQVMHEVMAALPKEYSIHPNDFPNGLYTTQGHCNYGYLGFNHRRRATDEEKRIVARFAAEFGRLYQRFLDLKRAEEQARESEIQLALERVRAKSLAMHHSDELHEVIREVFLQLAELNLQVDSSCIDIFNSESYDLNLWVATTGDDYPQKVRIPITNSVILKDYVKARKEQRNFLVSNYTKRTKDAFFDYAFAHSDLKNAPEKRKKYIYQCTSFTRSATISEHFSIWVMNYNNLPYTDQENEILKRFTTVFEQSYTRFLDLQKAEAQARESQIEAALERVRSKTMAMHNSHDVADTIVTLFDEVLKLGLDDDIRCGIGILEGSERMETWSATSYPNGEVDLKMGMLVMTIHPLLKRIKQAWKDGISHYTDQMTGNSVLKYYTALNNEPDYSFHRSLNSLPKKEFHNSFSFSEGILFSFSPNQMSEEAALVLERFARVFGQTYRRYIDLQKAEAQAREAQIEAALERIRSKAMAMQSSSDLLEVSNVLRDQMGYLGQQELESSLIHLYNNPKTLESWYTFRSTETDSTKIVTDVAIIPVDSCEYIRETMEKYHSKEKEYTFVSKGKKLVDWYNVMVKVAPDTIEYDKEGKMIVPDILYYHHSKFNGGALLMISTEKPSEEAKELQRRAAKVFNLAYQRFLDFQQAEARARESLRQASLDRVRGEIASMRSKDDLERITPLIWQELTALGVPFIRCGVFIIDEENKIIESHLSSPDGKSLGLLNLPYDANKVSNNSVKYWRKGKIYKDHWNKDQFLKFMRKMVKLGRLENPELYQGATSPPESLDLHFVPFKQGMLYVGNIAPLNKDEIQLVQSLAEAFSIAYARYEDFSQLEQAKNQIENALSELRSTQTQLIHSEKMASLGELTAGIAHEIQNPLNFVNNFSEVSADLIAELKEEIADGNEEEVAAISEDLIQNLEKIHHHGQRASSIVKGMLEHSRTGTHEKELTDLNVLADEYLRLAYHGLRAKDKSFNAEFKADLDDKLPKVNLIGQDIGRVLLNLINNAFYAVSSKAAQSQAKGATEDGGYKPEVSVVTRKNDNTAEIVVEDNGGGIPKNVVDKIFQPFFSTKPTGQGTGLGLSLSYDIITKGHDGHLEVETEEGMGTRFVVRLPIV